MALQRCKGPPTRVNGSSDPERSRLAELRNSATPWRLWGPYLGERQWGTVREDYSPDGSAWDSFPHDQARSRAYRWGEDGIAGISDDHQYLCFALAMWNGKDAILKERLFGLTGSEGNHGEDVKELYYYLDSTPTHSYFKMLYKYPQSEYPYAKLVEENRRRGKTNPEFEIVDCGIFDDDRYFDVFVEYAKVDPTDLLIEITVHNRGPDTARLDLLPQLWFRNTWSWSAAQVRPEIHLGADGGLALSHEKLGNYHAYADGEAQAIFCDNDTNVSHVFGVPSAPGYFKDAFHEYLVHGNQAAINPRKTGTKAAFRYALTIPANGSTKVRLRLSAQAQSKPFAEFSRLISMRKREADAFYEPLQAHLTDSQVRGVQRQAWAGMLWSKQYYHLNVNQWLCGDPNQPVPPKQRCAGRNSDWPHLHNSDVISMPDKWEYPWYAAWDLAFHSIPLAMIDADFAKEQLVLLTREWYMHPNGQLPAYEWAFGDVNPPVHAWAAWRVYRIDQEQNGGKGDIAFLERICHKLLLNFTWWVNRKDVHGRNIFQGGFLGLDNIGVFDRSAALPTGGFISQCDGTAWMAMYSLNLMRIALELSTFNPVYQDSATKFFEHFLYIAEALTNLGGRGIDLWDGGDEFYYDVLCLPDGHSLPLKVRSMVGLIPLFAVEVLDSELLNKVPQFKSRLEWFLKHRPDLASLVSRWEEAGHGESRLLSLLRGHRMKRLLKRMLDETEFLSDFGVRAISRYHRDTPYVFSTGGQDFTVRYTPGESDTSLFGGNSNWRGPIWFPVNYLLVESIRRFHNYYGDDFKVECPTGSGNLMTLHEVADELAKRLTRIFLPDANGKRPVFNHHAKLQDDPHFRDHLLFYEYFHGDSGRGVGASHQTGWTGLIAALIAPHDHPHFEPVSVTSAPTTASNAPVAITT